MKGRLIDWLIGWRIDLLEHCLIRSFLRLCARIFAWSLILHIHLFVDFIHSLFLWRFLNLFILAFACWIARSFNHNVDYEVDFRLTVWFVHSFIHLPRYLHLVVDPFYFLQTMIELHTWIYAWTFPLLLFSASFIARCFFCLCLFPSGQPCYFCNACRALVVSRTRCLGTK